MSDGASADELARKYDLASVAWADKMRILGYFDAYLGFLSAKGFRAQPGRRVIDVGCGTAALAEAWIAVQGPEQKMCLLDPSAGMLDRAQGTLRQRNVEAETACVQLEAFEPSAPFESVLAAHVLEHSDNPLGMLCLMRRLTQAGGQLWLIASKPHWCNAIIWLEWRHRTYPPLKVADLLHKAGWELELEYPFPTGPPSRTSRGYLARAI